MATTLMTDECLTLAILNAKAPKDLDKLFSEQQVAQKKDKAEGSWNSKFSQRTLILASESISEAADVASIDKILDEISQLSNKIINDADNATLKKIAKDRAISLTKLLIDQTKDIKSIDKVFSTLDKSVIITKDDQQNTLEPYAFNQIVIIMKCSISSIDMKDPKAVSGLGDSLKKDILGLKSIDFKDAQRASINELAKPLGTIIFA